MDGCALIVLYGLFHHVRAKDADSALRRSGAHDFHPGKTAAEAVDLAGYLAYGGAAPFNLGNVFLCEHMWLFVYIKFIAVGIFAAQLLEASGSAPEEEIVSEYGVIVLQDCSNLSLRLSGDVYDHGP